MKHTLLIFWMATSSAIASFAQAPKPYVIDLTFKSPDFVGDEVPLRTETAPILLHNGKILANTPRFDFLNGRPIAGNVVRLNADGSFDESFSASYIKGSIVASKAIGDQEAMAVLYMGWGANELNIAKFGPNGLDTLYTTAFMRFFESASIQSDQKVILFSAMDGLTRLLPNGEVDRTFRFTKEGDDVYGSYGVSACFGEDDKIRVVHVQPGSITIRVYGKEGDLERKYELNKGTGPQAPTFTSVVQVAFFRDGKAFVKSRDEKGYAIFDTNGKLELAHRYPAGVYSELSQSFLLPDGNFIEATPAMPYKITATANAAVAMIRDSTLLAMRAGNSRYYGKYNTSLLPNGELLIWGTYSSRELIWFNEAGFEAGRSNIRLAVSKLNGVRAVLPDRQALIDVQERFSAQLYRLRSDGGIDGNIIYESRAIKLPPQYTEAYFDSIAAYKSDGAFRYTKNTEVLAVPDGSFIANRQTSPNSVFQAFANTYRISADGKVDERFLRDSASTYPLPGNFFLVNTWKNYSLVKFVVDGEGKQVQPQNGFHSTILREGFFACRALKDGSVLTITSNLPDTRPIIYRFRADGTPDSGFQPIVLTSEGDINLKATYDDGRLLIFDGNVIKRYLSDGRPDPAFRAIPLRPYDPLRAFILPDQKILVWGTFNTSEKGFIPRYQLMRFHADGSPDATFALGSGINPELITSVHPVSANEMLVVYKGRIERLVPGDSPYVQEGDDMDERLTAWPNPGNGAFQLDLPVSLQGGAVEVLDMSGRPVPFTRVAERFRAVAPTGSFLLVRVSKNGKSATTRLLVR